MPRVTRRRFLGAVGGATALGVGAALATGGPIPIEVRRAEAHPPPPGGAEGTALLGAESR